MSEKQSIASKFAERFLVGAVESIARAGAKAVESLAGDARKALALEAEKAKMVEQGVAMWRQFRLGEIQDVTKEDAAASGKEQGQ